MEWQVIIFLQITLCLGIPYNIWQSIKSHTWKYLPYINVDKIYFHGIISLILENYTQGRKKKSGPDSNIINSIRKVADKKLKQILTVECLFRL